MPSSTPFVHSGIIRLMITALPAGHRIPHSPTNAVLAFPATEQSEPVWGGAMFERLQELTLSTDSSQLRYAASNREAQTFPAELTVVQVNESAEDCSSGGEFGSGLASEVSGGLDTTHCAPRRAPSRAIRPVREWMRRLTVQLPLTLLMWLTRMFVRPSLAETLPCTSAACCCRDTAPGLPPLDAWPYSIGCDATGTISHQVPRCSLRQITAYSADSSTVCQLVLGMVMLFCDAFWGQHDAGIHRARLSRQWRSS